MRIIVYDQEPRHAGVVCKFVASFGHDVVLTISIVDFIDKISERRFDGVFCDFNLQSVNGFNAVRAIKERGIPFVGMSYFSVCDQWVQLGASGFVSKPIVSESIQKAIKDCLTR